MPLCATMAVGALTACGSDGDQGAATSPSSTAAASSTAAPTDTTASPSTSDSEPGSSSAPVEVADPEEADGLTFCTTERPALTKVMKWGSTVTVEVDGKTHQFASGSEGIDPQTGSARVSVIGARADRPVSLPLLRIGFITSKGYLCHSLSMLGDSPVTDASPMGGGANADLKLVITDEDEKVLVTWGSEGESAAKVSGCVGEKVDLAGAQRAKFGQSQSAVSGEMTVDAPTKDTSGTSEFSGVAGAQALTLKTRLKATNGIATTMGATMSLVDQDGRACSLGSSTLNPNALFAREGKPHAVDLPASAPSGVDLSKMKVVLEGVNGEKVVWE